LKPTKNLLFVTWDSESTNYLESLFFPIFKGLQEKASFKVHVMQFSWADEKEVHRLSDLAGTFGITYTQYPIHRKPIAALGALLSVYQGLKYIKKYIQAQQIDTVMPRSTMPAMMVNRLRSWLSSKSVSVVFDADGFPLEERVDYAGLDPHGLQYRLLKKVEEKMLKQASKVLVRTQKAMDIHVIKTGESFRHKFFVVGNGRDSGVFKCDLNSRFRIRRELGLSENGLLWVYTGTVGPQYMVEDMLDLFETHHKAHPDSKFLIMTRNSHYVEERISAPLKKYVVLKFVNFNEIPDYLSAGDVGLSLRKYAPSLAGIAPIKLGEYLLCGMPVIASKGVGDTEKMLEEKPFCYLLEKEKNDSFSPDLADWIQSLGKLDRNAIRDFGMAHFSLEKSIESYLKALRG
jgi:glycosyltransferase involved in cell wall biosynthesis